MSFDMSSKFWLMNDVIVALELGIEYEKAQYDSPEEKAIVQKTGDSIRSLLKYQKLFEGIQMVPIETTVPIQTLIEHQDLEKIREFVRHMKMYEAAMATPMYDTETVGRALRNAILRLREEQQKNE